MVGSCGDKPCKGRDICMPAGNTFLCRNSDCPKAPLVGNATSTGIKEIGGKMVYNCTEPRHRIIGLDNVQCEWMNNWSSNTGITCTADCGGHPPSPTNGKVTGTHFLQGDEVTYSCNTDYMLAGERTSTCLSNGRWSNIDSTTCWPICSSALHASTDPGTMVSHADYGLSLYDDDMDSCWVIEARQGYTIDFTFMAIEIENRAGKTLGNAPCPYDFVKVFNGFNTETQQLGKYCGSTVSGSISSTGRYLLVHFTTDASGNFGGFKAEYKEGGQITP